MVWITLARVGLICGVVAAFCSNSAMAIDNAFKVASSTKTPKNALFEAQKSNDTGFETSSSGNFDANSVRKSMYEVFYSPNFVVDRSQFGFAEDSIIVWGKPLSIEYIDLTDRGITGRLPFSLATAAGFISINTNIKINTQPDAVVKVILSDSIVNLDANSKSKYLVDKAALSSILAEQLVYEISRSKNCYSKKYIGRDGNLESAVVLIYPQSLLMTNNDPSSVVQCVYESLVGILGFPRGDVIEKMYGDQIGRLDMIGLKSIYACIERSPTGVYVSKLACVLRSIPDDTLISVPTAH